MSMACVLASAAWQWRGQANWGPVHLSWPVEKADTRSLQAQNTKHT